MSGRGSLVTRLAAVTGWECWWCGDELTSATATVDHVIPRCRGGFLVASNVVLACSPCNHSKGDQMPADWVASPKFVHLGHRRGQRIRARVAELRLSPPPRPISRRPLAPRGGRWPTMEEQLEPGVVARIRRAGPVTIPTVPRRAPEQRTCSAHPPRRRHLPVHPSGGQP